MSPIFLYLLPFGFFLLLPLLFIKKTMIKCFRHEKQHRGEDSEHNTHYESTAEIQKENVTNPAEFLLCFLSSVFSFPSSVFPLLLFLFSFLLDFSCFRFPSLPNSLSCHLSCPLCQSPSSLLILVPFYLSSFPLAPSLAFSFPASFVTSESHLQLAVFRVKVSLPSHAGQFIQLSSSFFS